MTHEKEDPGRSDGGRARSRLVMAALRVFADKGFEAATTREICELAKANISAIRYYFGDKAGLYRAAFTEPLGDLPCYSKIEVFADRPLPEALTLFYREFLEPLKRGEELQLVVKLHFREMIEPTGVFQEEIEAEIKPQHESLVTVLMGHLGLAKRDPELDRLAFALVGMALHLYVGQEVIAVVAPHLMANPEAVDQWGRRLAGYAMDLIEGEAKRRGQEGRDGSR
ncbi:MAG: helix-turn-helix transcriptional regulator [Methylococcaceae bacterium]|nr:helix-turn-helix transcriptional regulator [Methylococcaceae bacterium]